MRNHPIASSSLQCMTRDRHRQPRRVGLKDLVPDSTELPGRDSLRRARFGSGDHNHLSRRLLQLAGVLAVLLMVTVVFAWLHGGNEVSLNPIAQAAARTQEASGGRTSFHVILQGGSQSHPVATSGTGVFNGVTNRSQMTLSVPTPSGGVES